MTDELYQLYLDTFTAKLAGASYETIVKALSWAPSMKERAVIALALTDASLPPSLSTRVAVTEAIDELLEVK